MSDNQTTRQCPFCGSADTHIGNNETKEVYPDRWFVACGQCGAQGPAAHLSDGEPGSMPIVKARLMARAAERWNDR